MRLAEPRHLITGDYLHADFRDFLKHPPRPTTFASTNVIEKRSLQSDDFDLVVIAQSRPGQVSQSIVETIQCLFPWQPIVLLAGSWCEGETRTGRPAPGLIRIYWHQWLGRYELFVEEFTARRDSSWHVPRTATRADRLLAGRKQRIESRQTNVAGKIRPLEIGVSCHWLETFEWIADALSTADCRSTWIERLAPHATKGTRLDGLVVDGNSFNAAMRERLGRLKNAFPTVPMIGLLNFPRKFETDDAFCQGMVSVVSKPLELEDLHFAVRQMVGEKK
jgi:hypothetical protein